MGTSKQALASELKPRDADQLPEDSVGEALMLRRPLWQSGGLRQDSHSTVITKQGGLVETQLKGQLIRTKRDLRTCGDRHSNGQLGCQVGGDWPSTSSPQGST